MDASVLESEFLGLGFLELFAVDLVQRVVEYGLAGLRVLVVDLLVLV